MRRIPSCGSSPSGTVRSSAGPHCRPRPRAAATAESARSASTSPREARGAGLGRALLAELVERSEHAGYWTLTAGVFPENEASVRLHKSCGFREVGVRERIGEAGGVWRDVILLERRSTLVGT